MALLEGTKKLGFGLMRLPKIGEEEDIEQVCQMADYFLEHGFKYFDTAYGYDNGKSEAAVKEVLVKRHPRESFYLATKLPAWAGAKTAEEARQMFWTSLERTGAGYFDFYLLHNLAGDRTTIFETYDLWTFVKEQKEKGLIKHLGFSYHGKCDELDEILTKHPEVEFVQLQINYADMEDVNIQSRLNLEVANKHNVPVIIMEPVKGGTLFNLPTKVNDIFKAYDKDASPASWAIRFAASQPGVVMVLSGMSCMDHMIDNVSFMDDFKPLTEKECEVVKEVQEALKAQPMIPCTSCSYCTKDCPMQINIPRIFSASNMMTVFENEKSARGAFERATKDRGTPADCIGCGQCESVCPQQLSIIQLLQECNERFQ